MFSAPVTHAYHRSTRDVSYAQRIPYYIILEAEARWRCNYRAYPILLMSATVTV